MPLQIASLFPKEDLIKLGNCSPTAFFHERGEYDKEKNTITVNLSRKILIFLDQPSNLLLGRLRSLFSHDDKEMTSKITDKNQKGGNRTKTVVIKGFPSVIFCTANLEIDEQEGTRFLLLSPEINQGKISQGISEIIKKEANPKSYKAWLEENPDRILLKQRIEAIREEKIDSINITLPEDIEKKFFSQNKVLKPRHQRDIKRLICFIKALALLNLWWRDKSDNTIIANENDIEQAFQIWDKIAVYQDLSLPPYIYNLFQEVILPAWHEKNSETQSGVKMGLTRHEILKKHYEVYGRILEDWRLRHQIIRMLETSGLIFQENDPNDRRVRLIYPTTQLTN